MNRTAPGITKTPPAPATPDAAALFAGPGEMRALCRAYGWETTSLGSVASWSRALCNTVRTVMGARSPAFLWLGPDLVQIFNDAYRPSLGEGNWYQQALGAHGAEFWADIWPIIGPQVRQVLAGGEATWHENQLVPITRNGRIEDVYWTYGYSAVFDDDGAIDGVLVLCQETTDRILAEREQVRLAKEAVEANRRAAQILEQVADQHLTMDAEFRILTMNAAAERGFGLPRTTLLGQTYWKAFPASVGSRADEQFRRAMRERVPVHFAHHSVGERYDLHLDIDAYPTDDGGLALFWRDVSARVHAEHAVSEVSERYHVLFESVDTGVAIIQIVVDANGHAADFLVLEVNAAFVEHTGVADAVGRKARDLVPGMEIKWVETYARVAATGETVHFEQGS